MSVGAAMAAGRTGFNSYCVCCACLSQFDLDLKRDERRCPQCASVDVKSVRELTDRPCPKCKIGTVRRGSPIRWRLDDDRATLPVPDIVKHIVNFEKDRVVTPPLQRAYELAMQVPEARPYTFTTVCSWILGWWQGDYFGKALGGTTEQQACTGPCQPQWTWAEAFRRILREVPELSELADWKTDRFCFKPTVSADVRRGIKNYVREHREVVVEA